MGIKDCTSKVRKPPRRRVEIVVSLQLNNNQNKKGKWNVLMCKKNWVGD